MKSDNEQEMNDELIARYLAGEATPEDAMAMEDWLTQPVNKLRFEELQSAWNGAAGTHAPVFHTSAAWNKFESVIDRSENKKGKKHLLGNSTMMLRIAAALLLVAAGAVLVKINLKSETKYSTLATTAETKVVSLADQSVVTVYRHTVLDYPVEFKKDARELRLRQGEAFFQVMPDKQKPFIVHTTMADIKVVGTAFNVVTTKDHTEVSVKEGKVWAYSGADSALLTPGSTAVFSKNQKLSVTQQAEESNVWGYATHKLVFKDTPMKTVINDIEKAYTCSISVANKSISNCKLTATFDNDSVDKVVNLIAEILNLKVKQNGKDFTLEGEGCP